MMDLLQKELFGMKLQHIDDKITGLMGDYGLLFLRYSLGIVFIWFGLLKPLGLSSAQQLVENTVFFFPSNIFIPVLGIWEVIIGIGLIFKKLNRLGILLLYLQMPGTFLPLILLPSITWNSFLVPSLEGQYIIKNLVLISAGLVIGSRVNASDQINPSNS